MLRDTTGDKLEKFCPKCAEWKPLEAFHLDKSRGDGRTPSCRACRKEKWANHD